MLGNAPYASFTDDADIKTIAIYGVMQLVDRKIHRQTGYTDGFSIWGPEN